MDEPTAMPPRRRIDAMSGLMSAITLAALIGAVWMRFGPSSRESPTVAVGRAAPPLRLLDMETSEPLVLVGLEGKVVWVVFWSAEAASGRSCLAELAAAVKRLQAHRRFALVTAAVEAGAPAHVRAAVAAIGVDLPVYLASATTRRQFGAETADPPLHVLIDADGRVLAMAVGAGRPTLERFAAQAGRRLDELDPLGETRFAARGGRRCDAEGRVLAMAVGAGLILGQTPFADAAWGRSDQATLLGANDRCPLAKVPGM